jgi:hypothetical protein
LLAHGRWFSPGTPASSTTKSGRHVIGVKIRILSFWSKMLFGKESKLSSIIYRLCFEIYTVNDANFPWLKNVHNSINECGLAYIWNTQTFINRFKIMAFVLLMK